MESQLLPIGRIYPRANGRPVNKAAVTALVGSLDAIGLQTPITVSPAKRLANGKEIDAYEIVAGRHRYEAALRLKWQAIRCIVLEGDEDDAALWEIDENLIRAELSDAQRAEHHVRRQQIMVRKGLVAEPGRGGDRRSNDKLSVGPSYAKQAAATLGVDERTVQRDLQRGNNIAPDVLAQVAGTDLDKGVVLDRLARTAPANQPKVLAEIKQERASKSARAPISDTDATERQLDALMRAWNSAGPDARAAFLAHVGAVQQPGHVQ